MKSEAAPVASALGLRRSVEPFGHYKGENIKLFVSGVGAVNSSSCVQRAMEAFPSIRMFVNIGVCGCRDSKIQRGSLFLINEIQRSGDLPYYPDMIVKSDIRETGITQFDSPSADRGIGTLLADMESHAFYRECLGHVRSPHIHLLKVVSDNMEPMGVSKSDVSAYIHMNGREIADYVEKASLLCRGNEPPDMSGWYRKYRFTAAMEERLDRLNEYHFLRFGQYPGAETYGGFEVPGNKKESKEIYNEITGRLV